MSRSGTLIIIGGHEEKDDQPLILREVVRHVNRDGEGKLVVFTVASEIPGKAWEQYEGVFRRLGVRHVYRLDVGPREEARAPGKLKILADATGVFFTGGDQLKITSLIGDSPICDRIHSIYNDGGVIAGTSAGASVMSETMVVGGVAKSSARIGATLRMAPGLGLIKDVLVDQHFAQRGRAARMLGAIAQNPRVIGLGIDEDTAIVVQNRGRQFRVIGDGAVYVFDAGTMTYTNLTEARTDHTLSLFNARVHMLSQGDRFDLATRVPINGSAEAVERELDEVAAS